MNSSVFFFRACFAVSLTACTVVPAYPQVVISQIYGGGGNAGATYKNDFIELFNAGNSPVSLNGYSVQYASSTGTIWTATALTNLSLSAGQYYLIQQAFGAGGTTDLPIPDATGTIAMSATAGKVALVASAAALTGCSDGTILDLVGYGTGTTCSEGPVMAALTNTTAGIRAGGGCTDTGSNAADFSTAAPAPRNSKSTLNPCSGGATNPSATASANPSALAAGAVVLFSGRISEGTNPASNSYTVTCNLAAIGGSSSFGLTVAGTALSGSYAIPSGTAGGSYSLPCSVTDNQNRTGSFAITLTVTGASAAPSAAGTASVNPVIAGNSTALSATNTAGAVPLSLTFTDTCDLRAIGGLNPTTLPVSYVVPASTAAGTYLLPCTVTDDQNRTGNFTISLTVTAPPPTLRLISEINGPGTTSPYASTQVTTRGVVTGVRSTTGSTKGFFIESVASDRDRDVNTPEGLLIFTGSGALPSCAVVGNNIQIQGTVQDFVPSTAPMGSVPQPELSSTSNCSVLAAPGVASLPPAVTLDGSNITAGGAATQARKYLGMRVAMSNVTVVGPSTGTLTESNATSTVGSSFWVTARGVSRPFHNTPGIQATRRPVDAANSVPSWNGNPEAIEIDASALLGGANIAVAAGSTVSSITGIMDYDTSAGQYQIVCGGGDIGAVSPSSPTLAAAVLDAPLATDLLIVDANIERFYDTVSNGGDVVLTQAAYDGRLNKLSLAIRDVMRMPDIIALEEVEGPASGNSFPVLQDIVRKINSDASVKGQGSPNYGYCGGLTNDPGKIAPAVIFRQDRVTQLECAQYGISTVHTLPYTTTPTTNVLNDRPPVVFRGRVTAAGSDSPFDIRIVVNHLRSLSGNDAPGIANGDRVRTKRNEQAKYVANLVTGNLGSEQSVNWNLTDNLLVAGDMNSFDVNDGYSDSVNCIAGSPAAAAQVYATQAQSNASSPCVAVPTLALTNLTAADPAQRYSYSFSGTAQRIDHILVNARLNPRVRKFAYVRNNADFPEGPAYRNDFNRPERFSDHDAPAVYLKLPVEITSRTHVNTSEFVLNRVTGRYQGTVSITNTGTQTIGGPVYVFFSLPTGVTLPLLPTANGQPYVIIYLPGAVLPAGATSSNVRVGFANPGNVPVSFTTISNTSKRYDTNF